MKFLYQNQYSQAKETQNEKQNKIIKSNICTKENVGEGYLAIKKICVDFLIYKEFSIYTKKRKKKSNI